MCSGWWCIVIYTTAVYPCYIIYDIIIYGWFYPYWVVNDIPHTYIYIHIYTYVYIHIYTYIYIQLNVFTYIYIYLHIMVKQTNYKCVYIFIQLCYIYIHINAKIEKLLLLFRSVEFNPFWFSGGWKKHNDLYLLYLPHMYTHNTCIHAIYIYMHFFISTWFPDYDIHIFWVGMQNHHFRKEKHWLKQDHFSIANRYSPISPIIDVQKKRFPQENWWNKGWFSTSKGLQESNWPELDDGNPGVSPGIYHPRSILSGGSEVGAERQYGCSVRNWNCWGGVAWRRRWDSHGIDGLFIDGLPIKNGDFP